MNLPDALMDRLRARAADSGRTATSLMVEALRRYLDEPENPAIDAPLPEYGSPDQEFLVDLTDREAVWAALDDHP